jgi:hypothetical protein
VGKDTINDLQDLGLANETIPSEIINKTADLIEETAGGLAPEEIDVILNTSKTPQYPVQVGSTVRPKLEKDSMGNFANLYITEDDMHGLFDYIPDVKSMAVGVSDEQIRGRNEALTLLLNPAIEGKLTQAGESVNIVELVKQILYDNGVKNPDKLFEQKEKINEQSQIGLPNISGAGIVPPSTSPIGLEANSGMANAPELSNQPTQVSQPF